MIEMMKKIKIIQIIEILKKLFYLLVYFKEISLFYDIKKFLI
jgi:heme-binding NEAT domain protein